MKQLQKTRSKLWVSKYQTILIVLLSSFFTQLEGQVYNFSNFTVETGLSQSQVLSVFQNDDGVIWYGTNGGGITKYDGNSFEYITDKDGLADNVVYCIAKDKKGRIFIGTNNGLSVFDGISFKNYTTKNGLSHNRIFTIFFDSKGRTLLGTGKGISIFQESFSTAFNIEESLNTASVFNILEDTKKNLWFSTIGNGAYKYDGKTLNNYTSADGLRSDYVYSILEFDDGIYWFLTEDGLTELSDKRFKLINPANLSNLTYYSYLKDKNQNIWFASTEGILKYDGKNFLMLNQKNGLVNNKIWKIFEDRESNFWFASNENGISKLASERFYMYTVTDGLLSNKISRIFQSKDGRYWIGSDKGLSIYDGGNFTSYNSKDWLFNGISNDDVTAIAEDKNGNILIGTSYGVIKYNGKTFERIVGPDQEKLNYIYDIFIDKDGETWLGTLAGVAKIINGKIKGFNKQGISTNCIYKIYEDVRGDYWYATDDGLYMYNASYIKHFTQKDGFTNKRVYNILNDAAGNLWFATSSGIFKYSKGEFSKITEKEGLSSNDAYSIAIDKEGVIWAGLPNGVDKIQIKPDGSFRINHYQTEDGFIGKECIFNSILVDKQERVWLGTVNGLVVYQPHFDRKNTLEPITCLKSINLFSQKTDWRSFAHSVDRNKLPVDLELSHEKNYLTFNFIGVSLSTPTKVKYKFMLKGLDKDWLPETFKNEASYSNLPPGKYEFLLIANNGDGVWNKEPVSFKFVILPPFWQTWWFYSIIAIIILIAIYSYVKIKSANVKILKQNEIIEEKNADLHLANLEIAEKNRNITDSINYAKRIQNAVLSPVESIKKHLPESFILYKPKDIVAGDFYWIEKLDDTILIAAADCTGHGVPGAMVSVICSNALNRSVNEFGLRDPGEILDKATDLVLETFEKSISDVHDGMDISLLAFNKTTKQIQWSGANNPLWYFHNNKKLTEIKPDKQPIGKYHNRRSFTTHNIEYSENSTFYLFTDGLSDQFGGTKGKKFMSKNFKKALSGIYDLDLWEQEEILKRAFNDWKGNLEQVDDVTIIGIRL